MTELIIAGSAHASTLLDLALKILMIGPNL